MPMTPEGNIFEEGPEFGGLMASFSRTPPAPSPQKIIDLVVKKELTLNDNKNKMHKI